MMDKELKVGQLWRWRSGDEYWLFIVSLGNKDVFALTGIIVIDKTMRIYSQCWYFKDLVDEINRHYYLVVE